MKIAIISKDLKWSPLKFFLIYRKYLGSKHKIKLFYCVKENLSRIDDIYYFNNIYILKNYLEDFDPDVLHIHRPNIGKDLFKLILDYKKIPKIEHLHLNYWDEFSCYVNAHISPSSFLVLELFKRNKIPENLLSKFFINHNPIDVENILSINKKKVMKIKSELAPNDEILLGIVTRPDHTKIHHQIFAKMLYMLSKRLKNFKFIDIGGIPLEFKRRIYPLIKENIFVDLGPIFGEKLYEYLSALDIYAYYSVYGETFGISIAEAMTAGLPVVLNNTPYSTNAQTLLVDNGINGYVTNSMKGWVDAIIKLAKKPELREKMGIKGREKILEKYHPKDTIKELENIYEKVIKGEVNTKIDLKSIEIEFNKRKESVFDSGLKYLPNSIHTYVYSRVQIGGGFSETIKNIIRLSKYRVLSNITKKF